jgi:hypothetical protein
LMTRTLILLMLKKVKNNAKIIKVFYLQNRKL